MLADEVTHVKMGSDWLRRLTENDPERRERALEFQRTVDSDLQPRRLPRRGRREPDPARPPLPRARRLHRRGERLARRARPRVDRAGARDGRDGDRRARRVGAGQRVRDRGTRHRHARPVHARSPTTRPRSRRSSRTSPRWSGFPPDVEIDVDVDEELFAPLDRAHVRRRRRPRRALDLGRQLRGQPAAAHVLAPSRPAVDLAVMLLRAKDRLSDDFADAPPDRELARGERAAWDIYAVGPGRAARHRRCAASASSTTSGCSTASPTSPTPRSSGCWERRSHDVRGHPRDLQGDRRRRPRRRRRSPSTSSARSRRDFGASAPRSAFAPTVARSWAEIVSRGRSSGFAASSGTPRCAMSVMSVESRWRLDRIGRIPLLDHQESTTVRGRRDEVDVAASAARRGSSRRSARAPRRALPRAPGRGVEGRGEHRDLDVARHHASSRSARDRDRGQQSVADSLGPVRGPKRPLDEVGIVLVHGWEAPSSAGLGSGRSGVSESSEPPVRNEGLRPWRRSVSSGTRKISSGST